MTLLQSARVAVRPRYRINWIRGRRKTDGLEWYVRGTDFSPSHENWLRSLVNPFNGDLFVDVGAHVGTWAVRAARTFRRVVAFEPIITTNKILRTTVTMNGFENVSVFSAALSNTHGEMRVSTKSLLYRRAVEHLIPIRTLDSFKLKPSLVKIDTEGNEYPVLQGAVETLKRKPRIVVETHSPETLRNVKNYLEALGYSITEVRRKNRFNQNQSWLLCN
ncbi:MAG TPA: FkbM family methyltransferase [Candidatus Bathyarchaeia archaeon]|nr:FkbM family methyltransferase [Candidatus Bathyarchaeia archaeon]